MLLLKRFLSRLRVLNELFRLVLYRLKNFLFCLFNEVLQNKCRSTLYFLPKRSSLLIIDCF